MKTQLITLFLICASLTNSAHAEVMDKEPSIMFNYLWGITGAIVCFISARYKPWLLLFVAPLPLFYFLALLFEILDPAINEAILKESGSYYIISSYILSAIILISIVAGLWLRKNEKT